MSVFQLVDELYSSNFLWYYVPELIWLSLIIFNLLITNSSDKVWLSGLKTGWDVRQSRGLWCTFLLVRVQAFGGKSGSFRVTGYRGFVIYTEYMQQPAFFFIVSQLKADSLCFKFQLWSSSTLCYLLTLQKWFQPGLTKEEKNNLNHHLALNYNTHKHLVKTLLYWKGLTVQLQCFSIKRATKIKKSLVHISVCEHLLP